MEKQRHPNPIHVLGTSSFAVSGRSLNNPREPWSKFPAPVNSVPLPRFGHPFVTQTPPAGPIGLLKLSKPGILPLELACGWGSSFCLSPEVEVT